MTEWLRLLRDLLLCAIAIACGFLWGDRRGHVEAAESRAACAVVLAAANEALERAQYAVAACVEATGMPRVREVRR